MNKKQIFLIVVLVGVAFAGIAVAGPTAMPPGGNVGSPIFSTFSNNIDQSKVGQQPRYPQIVPYVLAIGLPSFPTVNPATLYVEGQASVGSLERFDDPVIIWSNLGTDSFQVYDTVEQSTGGDVNYVVSVVKVKGLATDSSTSYKPLCVNPSSGQVIICN